MEGWGEIPTVLLTNMKIDVNNRLSIWRVVECYLTRWKCYECYRYIKQSYNTEDVRVRSYNSLRNIIAFINAISYFTSIYMGVFIFKKAFKELSNKKKDTLTYEYSLKKILNLMRVRRKLLKY